MAGMVAQAPAEILHIQPDLDSLDQIEPTTESTGRRRIAAAMSPALNEDRVPRTFLEQLTILEALELPARLDALASCDAAAIVYDPESFRLVCILRGRNAGFIAWPLACLFAYSCFAAIIFEFLPILRELVVPLEDVFSPLLSTISFLLVFRLGRAAVRYWEARSAAGLMVERCRVLASDSAVVCVAHPELRHRFARWLAIFPVMVKNSLRPASSECSRLAEIVPLVNESEAKRLLDPERTCAPIYVLNQLRLAAIEVAQLPELDPMLRAAVYQELCSSINLLTGAWGAMDRINGTPLPFVYVAHLRTFLLLYLFVFCTETVAQFGWVALPPLLAGSWALLGIEAAALECERPFQRRPNHLLLGRFACVVARHVGQTLRDCEARPHGVT